MRQKGQHTVGQEEESMVWQGGGVAVWRSLWRCLTHHHHHSHCHGNHCDLGLFKGLFFTFTCISASFGPFHLFCVRHFFSAIAWKPLIKPNTVASENVPHLASLVRVPAQVPFSLPILSEFRFPSCPFLIGVADFGFFLFCVFFLFFFGLTT